MGKLSPPEKDEDQAKHHSPVTAEKDHRSVFAIVALAMALVFILTDLLIHNTWSRTVKVSDMQTVSAELNRLGSAQSAQTEALKALNAMVSGIEDDGKSGRLLLAAMDGKLDGVIDQHLALMRALVTPPDAPQQKAPAVQAPSRHPHRKRPRARASRRRESGLSLWLRS